jgi:hypothetical protein
VQYYITNHIITVLFNLLQDDNLKFQLAILGVLNRQKCQKINAYTRRSFCHSIVKRNSTGEDLGSVCSAKRKIYSVPVYIKVVCLFVCLFGDWQALMNTVMKRRYPRKTESLFATISFLRRTLIHGGSYILILQRTTAIIGS